MLAVERLQYIMELLKENKVAMVSDLSKEVQVSEETVRRDLEKLEKQGKICRVHGGAYLQEGFGNETPITVREKIFQKEKASMAKKCMEFINEQDSIMLDCSTTAIYIAKELSLSKKKLTIITNSLRVAEELSACDSIRVIMLGGELKRSTNSFCGEITVYALNQYYAGKAFISGAGIDHLAGLTDYTQEEASIRRKMIERSQACYYVADLTKIGRTAVHTVSTLESIDCLITNEDFYQKDRNLKNELDRLRVKLVISG